MRPSFFEYSALPSAMKRILPPAFWSRDQAPITNASFTDRHQISSTPLRLELVVVLDVARHVLGRAGGREGAGQAEDRDLLALHHVLDLEGVRAHAAAVALDFDEFLQRAFGKLVTDLDRHLEILLVEWNRGGHRGRPPESRQCHAGRDERAAQAAIDPAQLRRVAHRPQHLRGRSRVAAHDDDVDDERGQREDHVLRDLGARQIDELRQDRGEEDDALGIGEVDPETAHEDPASGGLLVVAVLLEAARGRAPGDDPEIDEVGHADPFDEGEERFRGEQDRAQPERHDRHEDEVGELHAHAVPDAQAEAVVQPRRDGREHAGAGRERQDDRGDEVSDPDASGPWRFSGPFRWRASRSGPPAPGATSLSQTPHFTACGHHHLALAAPHRRDRDARALLHAHHLAFLTGRGQIGLPSGPAGSRGFR